MERSILDSNPDRRVSKAPPFSPLWVLGVDYAHLQHDDYDLYLTRYGLQRRQLFDPDNFWSDKNWFHRHSERLAGTSTVYRITTKPVDGRSIDIVLKWNRMGQDVPGDTFVDGMEEGEFNSPFEEFALVMEMRDTRYESPGQILTHKPLAIYVPSKKYDLDRMGRKKYRMEAMISSHREIELHIDRNYAVIYEWVKGFDALQALERGLLEEEQLKDLTLKVDHDMHRKGFLVGDRKPSHIIVRQDNGSLCRSRDGSVLYALVDFELMARTPEREARILEVKRKTYLTKQVYRFQPREVQPMPHLRECRILGVDYIYGHVESTDGALWVVGKDPGLFDFFLPEKWRRTPRQKLSHFSAIYKTTTKDSIHLVWKVSRVGTWPDMDPFKDDERRILDHGFNSPFEEVALSLELNNKGIPATWPRAVYMTGEKPDDEFEEWDERRFQSHAHITSCGIPVLQHNRDYILIWGYWNGPLERLAERDEDHYVSINALNAFRQGLIDEDMYFFLLQRTRHDLRAIGIEDLNLRGNHILLSLDKGHVVCDRDGIPEARICNFELLRRIEE